MNAAATYKKIGILLIAMSVLFFVALVFFNYQFFRFFELYFSSDQELTPTGKRELLSIFYFGVVVLLITGFGLLKAQDESWRTKIVHVFFGEPLTNFRAVKPAPQAVLIISTLIGLLLIATMQIAKRFASLYEFLYAKDKGLLDLFVPTTFVISAVLLGAAAWRVWNDRKLTKSRILLLAAYSLMAGLFFFYAGEEISWGQDFFRWQTPEVFAGNLESQTNLHNYFNPYFVYGYVALSLVLVIVLVSAWLELNQRWLPWKRLFLPHPSLIGLGVLIAFVSIVWYQEQELLEEMVAVFILLYSLRIFTVFRSRHLSYKTIDNLV